MTCVAWFLTLVMSWPAYIHNLRIFKLSPLLNILATTPSWVEWSLYALTLGLLAWLVIKPLHRAAVIGVLCCTLFWTLQDLMRFQPYIYLYFFTLFLATFGKSHATNALRIMVAGFYFWAGFYKINASFYAEVFPWFIAPFYKSPDESPLIQAGITLIIYVVPVFEAAIGILLLFFPRFYKLATGMAFVTLIVVLACLGPLGHHTNSIVIPWNIWLFLLEFVLFYKSDSIRPRLQFKNSMPTLVATTLFVIAPFLSIFDDWPSYPAFKLYSGNIQTADIILTNAADVTHLPEHLQLLVKDNHRLALHDWTNHELGMIVYPDPYVFHMGAQGLCPYLKDASHARLRIYNAPPFNKLTAEHHDFPLCPAGKQ